MILSPVDDIFEQQRVPRQCGYHGCPDDAYECSGCLVEGCVAFVQRECRCDADPDLWQVIGPVGSPPVHAAEVLP